DELAIARQAVRMARDRGVSVASDGTPPAAGHCGYYLIGPGRRELEAAIAFRPTLRDRVRESVLMHPSYFYFGALSLTTAAILAVVLIYAVQFLAPGAGWLGLALLLIGLASLLPASDLAVGLVHHFVTRRLSPRVMPKMDFKDGIPADCATFVVIPSL